MIVNFRRGYGQFITSGAQLLLLFGGLRVNSRDGWLVCLGLMAVISIVAWRSTLWRRRIIVDTPTSRIASAAQGYIELSGSGKPLDFPPLLSHLTTLPCIWYRYLVEERSSGRNKWRMVSSGESEVAFLLDDGSGRCVVDVEGAEIMTRHKKQWTEGRFRHTEWKLLIDDPVYALGEFRTLG
ncbi:MAG: GIDE domain-containing protein, partial [Propionivibrio sp.]